MPKIPKTIDKIMWVYDNRYRKEKIMTAKKTKRIVFRPGDDLWDKLMRESVKRKIKLSDLLREILIEDLEGK